MNVSTETTNSLLDVLGDIEAGPRYETSIGRTTFVDDRIASKDEVPCIFLIPGDETPRIAGDLAGSVAIEYAIVAYSNRRSVIAGHEYTLIDSMIADIRKAVEGDQDNICPLAGKVSAIIYNGGRRLFHAAGGELCACELRYSIATNED